MFICGVAPCDIASYDFASCDFASYDFHVLVFVSCASVRAGPLRPWRHLQQLEPEMMRGNPKDYFLFENRHGEVLVILRP